MEVGDNFISHLVFTDEATFHLNGKLNRHIMRTWGTEQPHEILEYVRDSPIFNVVYAVTRNKSLWPFFLLKKKNFKITEFKFQQKQTMFYDFINLLKLDIMNRIIVVDTPCSFNCKCT